MMWAQPRGIGRQLGPGGEHTKQKGSGGTESKDLVHARTERDSWCRWDRERVRQTGRWGGQLRRAPAIQPRGLGKGNS